MAQEYKIKSIFPDDPKKWKGPHGTIYYREVLVEGHDKPLSVGKKDPNALKEGDTIFGDIIESDYISDKFKPSSPPESVDNSETAQKPAYKDNSKSITLGMVWKTIAQIRGLPENDEEFAKFFEIVQSHLNELLLISDKMRECDEITASA